MAAQAWKLYPKAKHKIGAGDLPLDHTHFRISYVKSVFTTNTYSIWPQLVSAGIAVDATDKYPVSGFDLGSGVWTGYASAKGLTRKFDLTNPAVLTASATAITTIYGAVIWVSAAASANRFLLCYASLTSTPFDVGVGNTLTVTFASSGLFTLL